MNIVWTIVDVEAKTQPNKSGKGDDLEFLAVTYKSAGRDGRVTTGSKSLYKVYANPDVYAAVAAAKKGDEIGLRMEKNDRGYWDVVALADAASVPAADTGTAARSSPAAGRGTVTGNTYPTAEERLATQRNIVRQSCLAQAVAFVNSNQDGFSNENGLVPVDAVLDVAERFIEFIYKSE